MSMKIDLHNHSTYSQDGSSDPEECIIQAIELGLDGIAFTEHDYYEKSEPVEQLKEKYKRKIKIFRGVEYPSAEGHVLIFGVKNDSFHKGFFAPVKDIIRIVNEKGGIAIIPHPYRGWLFMQADLSGLNGINAIEAQNGRNTIEENDQALKMAFRLRMPTTGGSDSHEKSEVGRCYTEFYNNVDYGNFILRLKQGRYRGIDNRPPNGTK